MCSFANEIYTWHMSMENVAQTYSSQMKTADALWVLIQAQAQSVKDILYSRIKTEEEERRSQEMYVRSSLERAFSELSEAKRNNRELPDARSLFDRMDAK